MAKKRKSQNIRGRRQEFDAVCPRCMCRKRIEIRRAGKLRRIYGVVEKRLTEHRESV
jgi:hypothetical protein